LLIHKKSQKGQKRFEEKNKKNHPTSFSFSLRALRRQMAKKKNKIWISQKIHKLKFQKSLKKSFLKILKTLF